MNCYMVKQSVQVKVKGRKTLTTTTSPAVSLHTFSYDLNPLHSPGPGRWWPVETPELKHGAYLIPYTRVTLATLRVKENHNT
ncbi:hypothetical protein CI610_03436 [invertebrate metagenome]|uniref:Uncharacterized protein n=1 Tax=invertebrate metagenome TaxID=1711999 RepID=A0A2H9T374_9ZZZZ